ncbi:ATP-dependent DNA helicase RecG [Treponema sp. C6A8]|uniref:ATP-dependent DNA helicase RecG n=1 Tax=Treponema sp. C6A8 TaxID=1410609 RepID=UPI000481EB77|nr:ATP-dependent DNA helicase RecG [Treponema sp. C6A8]
MLVSEIKNPVSSISGVGPALTKNLAKLNIFTVGDLLQYFPRDYEDRTRRVSLNEFARSPKIHTVAKIVRQEWFGYGNMRTLKLIINDGTAQAELICFNRPFFEKSFPAGAIISVHGSFFVKYNALQSSSFEATVLEKPAVIPMPPEEAAILPPDLASRLPADNRVLPVYSLTEGVTQKTLTKAISAALQQYAKGIEDELPQEIIEKRGLLSKQDAIRMIHEPASIQEAVQARNTLSYEELFHFQSVILRRAYKHRGTLNPPEEPAAKPFVEAEVFLQSLSPLQKQFLEKLPFPLTDDQRTVIYQMDSEIDRGYEERSRILNQADRGIPLPKKSAFTMQRLLQGDVGSGKTLVSLFVCLRVISWKGQCALMAPTEILARQHAETASRLLDFLGIRVAFLTGNVKSAGRSQLLKNLKEGKIDIVIGTHALFSNQVVYNDLELAVIDEQHRFGVMQRQAIIAKGRTNENGITFEPHLLMMSATPIPQTLAYTIFGDLDVSTIKTLPQGRKPITTYLVKEGNEMNAYEAIRKELEKGHQAYFVYPAIDSEYTDDDGNARIKSAEKAFEHLSKHIYPQYKCALVHSRIDEEQQTMILNDFRAGRIQVLAATTVIEVGVDVPNATCIAIENADRFGMAQLHQLRGRVGRGSDQSYCFLIYSKNLTESGIERMKALRQSTDGFYIAEQDLKTRGPGELTGTLQAGALEFAIADIVRDKDLLTQARTDAIAYIQG